MVVVSVIRGSIRIIEELTDATEPNVNIQMLRECIGKSLEIMI